jgi:hypothetical protein
MPKELSEDEINDASAPVYKDVAPVGDDSKNYLNSKNFQNRENLERLGC